MNYTEKNKLIDNLCGIGLMLIFAEVFLAIVNSGYDNFGYVMQMPTILKLAGAVFLVISVIILVIAYKKDDGYKAMYGIEFLVMAYTAVILSYSYVSFPAPYCNIHKVFPGIFLGYYIVKTIVIIVKAKSKK